MVVVVLVVRRYSHRNCQFNPIFRPKTEVKRDDERTERKEELRQTGRATPFAFAFVRCPLHALTPTKQAASPENEQSGVGRGGSSNAVQ